jgi:hypothetical protein
MPDPNLVTRADLEAADRQFNALRSATTNPPDDPTIDEQKAAEHAAYLDALESELALLERLGNPRADQVRVELARARRRHIAAA